MRPRRHVEDHPLGHRVGGEPFVTTDPTLAAAVAAELDRVDPLPCHHQDGDLIDVATLDQPPGSQYLRTCCGERLAHRDRIDPDRDDDD